MALGHCHNGVHIARQAAHMHGDHDLGPRRDLALKIHGVQRQRLVHLRDNGHRAHG